MHQRYQLRVDAVLDAHWAKWFDDAELSIRGDQTVITISIADQAALHGALDQVRDLGLVLLSVHRVGAK